MTTKEVAVKESSAIEHGRTPADMIRLAVTSGTDLDKLEKLLMLQEKWEANEARKAYHQAMALFKANPPKIDKDKKVGYDCKTGGKVGYKHASLGNVTEKIGAELSKQGLSAAWATKQEGKTITVTCTITHKLGHSESTALSAEADATGSKNSIQAIGSTITYLERYCLLAITGLATFDMDDDGQAAATEYINDKELSQIVDMVNEYKIDEAKFLNYMKIESLSKMPKSEYTKAVAAISAKKKAGVK